MLVEKIDDIDIQALQRCLADAACVRRTTVEPDRAQFLVDSETELRSDNKLVSAAFDRGT
jgi:hypothetical protein